MKHPVFAVQKPGRARVDATELEAPPSLEDVIDVGAIPAQPAQTQDPVEISAAEFAQAMGFDAGEP